jgi:ankyrin repeat protein
MRFSALKHLPLLVLFLALLGCGNPQEEATRQLDQMGIKFTADSFVERARDGNLAAVKLFLQAGMKPNVTSAAGETPLLVAVQFGRQDVVEALLAQGAAPTCEYAVRGTPLMWASTKVMPGS